MGDLAIYIKNLNFTFKMKNNGPKLVIYKIHRNSRLTLFAISPLRTLWLYFKGNCLCPTIYTFTIGCKFSRCQCGNYVTEHLEMRKLIRLSKIYCELLWIRSVLSSRNVKSTSLWTFWILQVSTTNIKEVMSLQSLGCNCLYFLQAWFDHAT